MNNTTVGPATGPFFAGETAPPAGTAAAPGGFLFIGVPGGAGNDQLFVNLLLANDSQGSVVAGVDGGAGDDLVGLVVTLPSPIPGVASLSGFRQTRPTLTLDGGTGKNAGISTSNVLASHLNTNLIFF
jgi:hypothetical protein